MSEKLIDLTLRAKEIREKHNVLIQIYNNASGYLWALAKVDTGTDLGWCEDNGNCPMSGAFVEYEDALEDAVSLVEKCSLKKFQTEWNRNFHWGNYATHLNSKYRKLCNT